MRRGRESMSAFRADVLTLFPNMFPGALSLSLAGMALKQGIWSLHAHDIRDHGLGKHRAVDDTPAGGGAGMVIRADVLAASIASVVEAHDPRPRLLMSPRGKPLTQEMVRAFASGEGIVIICGRFEGVDERVIEGRNLQEVSIGDYILSGGEPAALVLLDAIVRLLPGVMGKQENPAKTKVLKMDCSNIRIIRVRANGKAAAFQTFFSLVIIKKLLNGVAPRMSD